MAHLTICMIAFKFFSKMSQSDAHSRLLYNVAVALQQRYPVSSILLDYQQRPGDPVPPILLGHRPDVYATTSNKGPLLIGEVKTDGEFTRYGGFSSTRTLNQVTSFISYLEESGKGVFALSVSGRRADRAKTLLRFLREEMHAVHTVVAVYDSLRLLGT